MQKNRRPSLKEPVLNDFSVARTVYSLINKMLDDNSRLALDNLNM